MMQRRARAARSGALAALSGLALLAGGCSRTGPAEDAPPWILLVTIDTLRADHLGCYGYFRDTSPSIDSLASDAFLFERAVATMATTLPSHLSILTSTHPRRHGVFSNDQRFTPGPGLRTLAEMLAEKGWETAGFVSSSVLDARTGIAAGFGVWSSPAAPERGARETTDLVLAWLRERGSRAPLFLWVHYFDPHVPHRAPAGFQRFRADASLERFLASRAIEPTPTVRRMHDRYDAEIAYVDAELGRLFAELRRLARWDRTAIVLTSDHGEGLWQHGWAGHGEIWNEQLLVPLLVRPPGGIEATRVPGVVSTVDIVPSLDALLGLGLGADDRMRFEGKDALDEGSPRPWAFAERVHRERGWAPGSKFALVSPEWKLVRHEAEPDRLYDLLRDPIETRDLADARPDVRQRLREQLDGQLTAWGEPAQASPLVDEDLLENLRSLGYTQ